MIEPDVDKKSVSHEISTTSPQFPAKLPLQSRKPPLLGKFPPINQCSDKIGWPRCEPA